MKLFLDLGVVARSFGGVSIPKRVLEALKPSPVFSYYKVSTSVSIPKRVLEALKLCAIGKRESRGAFVSIPKRVLEALKLPRKLLKEKLKCCFNP